MWAASVASKNSTAPKKLAKYMGFCILSFISCIVAT
jgi:hypothetical protein